MDVVREWDGNRRHRPRMLVSERTAKRMVAALLHKLGVSNRIAAAAMAGRFRLLDDLAETDGIS